jgi:hypothetical protein
MKSRRQFLIGVTTAGTIAIAGCSGGGGGGGPEGAAEQYITASKNGDAEAINEVLHPESDRYPRSEENVKEKDSLTIKKVEQVSTRRVVESQLDQFADADPTEQEVEKVTNNLEQNVETRLNETGTDEHNWVLATIEQGGEKTRPHS